MNSDEHIRIACQTNFHDHITLEAGAGSGKTATLIARILQWILKEGWKQHKKEESEEKFAFTLMHGVVAITFTESAAEEMVERLGEALISLSNYPHGKIVVGFSIPHTGLEIDTLKKRARLLLGVVDQMRISTIHSFCRSILKAYPLEAKLHPQFDIDADGNKAKQIAHEVLLYEFRDQLKKHADSSMRTIFEAGIPLNLFRDQLLEAVQSNPDIFVNPITEDNLRPTYEDIHSLIHALVPYFDKVPASGRTTHQYEIIDLIQLADLLLEGLSQVHSVSGRIVHEEALVSWAETKEKAIARIKKWSKAKDVAAKLSPEEKEIVAHLCTKLQFYLSQIKYYRPALIVHTVELLNKMMPQVRNKLRMRGIASFSDLLQKTAILLRNNSHIANKLRSEMHLLLVDEFQDTSIDQCDIIEILGLHPRREYPKLFIVGDPKQSIYGWLNADISSYFSFVDKIQFFSRTPGMVGHSWKLTANFRSVDPILRAVDDTFSGYMHNVDRFQASFSSLECMRSHDIPSFPSVEVWAAWPESICAALPHAEEKDIENQIKKITAAEALEEEAHNLARDLLRVHQENNVPWKDCALLFRSTSNLDVFLNELKKHQIPYAVTRDKNYYRRREILEVFSLLSCIVSPLDQISLIGVLRSSMVALPDAALFLLWKHGFPEMFAYVHRLDEKAYFAAEQRLLLLRPQIDRLAIGIDGYEQLSNWSDALCHFLRTVRTLRSEFQKLSSDVFLRSLREYVAFSCTEARAYQGSYRLANLDRFFYSIHCSLEENKGDWNTVLDSLSQAIQEGQNEEEARPADPNQDAVQIMTIHKSKGLDFEHVYVLELHRSSGNQVRNNVYGGFCGIFQTYEFSALGLRTLGYGTELERQQKVENFERLRLLYVAMTRAKNRLVLSGKFPAKISMGTQDSTDLMSQHLQSLFLRNGMQDLWKKPQSSILLRYLGENPFRGGIVTQAFRAQLNAATLQKHQDLLDTPIMKEDTKEWLSLGNQAIPFSEYKEIEQIFVPLLQKPQNISKNKRFILQKCSELHTFSFSLRDILATLFTNIPTIQNSFVRWYNHTISVEKKSYQIHRLEERKEGFCLIEYLFLESVQDRSFIDEVQNNWNHDVGIVKAQQLLQESFQKPVSIELWGLQSNRKWRVSQTGLEEIQS